MSIDVATTLQAGVAAFKAGDKATARQHFLAVIEAEETNEPAWLWLAGVMDDPAEVRICLENVLHLNPANAQALKGLEWLRKQNPALFAEVAPAATGETILLTQPAPTVVHSAPPAATGPTVALTAPPAPPSPPPAAPPVAGPTYQVPNADASVFAGLPDVQPCPRCGQPTQLRERRCRGCGQSLVEKIERRPGIRVPATVAGVMSIIYSAFYILGAFLIFGLASTGWSVYKKGILAQVPLKQQAKYVEDNAAAIDQKFEQIITPLINVGAVIMLIGIIGIVLAVGVLKLKRWGYWGSWIYFGLHWVIAVISFLVQSAAISSLLDSGASGSAESMLKGLRAGASISPIWLTIILICLGVAWKLFTRQTVRFLAHDPDSGDPSVHFNRGIGYRKRGMWYQSLVEWEKAVKLSPSDATYRHALGLVYAQMKRRTDALRELDEAVQLAPDNEKIHEDHQRVLAQA
jgi:tetratricopeptide (TPR) repeat protein